MGRGKSIKNKKYVVYKHTSPNNKVYVGITSMKITDRWRNGEGYNGQQYFYRAIKKYGWDNFKHEIIYEGLTKAEAEQKERELITSLKSNQKEYGYNIQNGGASNGKHSKETIEIIRYHASHCTEETKRKMSIAQSKRMKNPNNNPMYGKTHTEEARRKISMANKNKIISEATRCKMSKARKGMTQSEEIRNKISQTKMSKSKRVIQYTKTGEYVNTFANCKDVAKCMNVSESAIRNCCNGYTKTLVGYIWRYAND